MPANKIHKVLLVDDDPNVRLIAQTSLEGLTEWVVCLADSGPEAIELAKKEKPDLVILDMMMPGMDGLTTLKQMRGDVGFPLFYGQ